MLTDEDTGRRRCVLLDRGSHPYDDCRSLSTARSSVARETRREELEKVLLNRPVVGRRGNEGVLSAR